MMRAKKYAQILEDRRVQIKALIDDGFRILLWRNQLIISFDEKVERHNFTKSQPVGPDIVPLVRCRVKEKRITVKELEKSRRMTG